MTSKRRPSAKRRLKEHREEALLSDFWTKRFASEGSKSLESLEIQLKSLDRTNRRIARLETYIKRRSR